MKCLYCLRSTDEASINGQESRTMSMFAKSVWATGYLRLWTTFNWTSHKTMVSTKLRLIYLFILSIFYAIHLNTSYDTNIHYGRRKFYRAQGNPVRDEIFYGLEVFPDVVPKMGSLSFKYCTRQSGQKSEYLHVPHSKLIR